jgi:hypothetical protein
MFFFHLIEQRNRPKRVRFDPRNRDIVVSGEKFRFQLETRGSIRG